MLFRQLIDSDSSTYTFVLADQDTKEAVIIDPVREQFERDVKLLEQLGLKLLYVLETHVHADHITSAALLRHRLGARTVLSAHAGVDCADVQVEDGDNLSFGRHTLRVRTTPGHTNGDVVYVLTDQEMDRPEMVFTGDTLLVRGCGRTDFQQGDARALYRAVREKILCLPDATLLYPGHDYRGHTVTTVGEERRYNPRLADGVTEAQFVATMEGLDLALPKRLEASLASNLRCGHTRSDPSPGWAPVCRADGVPEVSPAWVDEAQQPGMLTVDVRQPSELRESLGHIVGATNVPLADLERAAVWDPSRPVVLVCRSGKRSARAAVVLQRLGFEHVASMRGGMEAWVEAGLPTSRTAGAA